MACCTTWTTVPSPALVGTRPDRTTIRLGPAAAASPLTLEVGEPPGAITAPLDHTVTIRGCDCIGAAEAAAEGEAAAAGAGAPAACSDMAAQSCYNRGQP